MQPMSLRLAVGVLAVAFHAATLSAAPASEPAWVTESNLNAKLLLDLQARFGPEGATATGVEGLEREIIDLKPKNYERGVAETRKVLKELERRRAAATHPKVRQDLDILIQSVNDNLVSGELNRNTFFPYFDPAGFIFFGVRSLLDPRVPKDKQAAVITRLNRYAGLEKGYEPLTELAKARTLERIKADKKLMGPYKGQVEQDLTDYETLFKGMDELLGNSGLDGWQAPVAALKSQLTDYREWVRKEILPRAAQDTKLPLAIYQDNLKQFGVDVPIEGIVAKALLAFAEMRNEAQVIAGLIADKRGLKDRDYRAVIRELKKDQMPGDKVLSTYEANLATIEAIIRREKIVSVPERKSIIKLATEAETAQQPAPHMRPPRLIGNTGEYGVFVLPAALPPDASGKVKRYDDFSHEHSTWTLTAHESRPGHEMQFAAMIEAGVSTARAVYAFNSVNVEGWALYAEAEMKPYLPLEGQLFSLQARMQRAARAFLDPMVNLGQITPDAVQDYLMDEVGLSEAMAIQEKERYTFRAPGQAVSYFYGYQRLMETRQRAEVALRDKFDRQAFNDFVLAQGLIPPALLEQAVMQEFVPARMK
jgi:hypothetical protein